jgi:hypothetical protein
MITSIRSDVSAPAGTLQARFLRLLPRIQPHAQVYFRDVRCACLRADCIAEVIALCWKWFIRLAARGKNAAQFVTTLAGFAARAVRSGRRVCGQQSARDVLSTVAQQQHGFQVEALPLATRTSHGELYGQPHGQQHLDAYEERLIDNHRTPVLDQVAFRIDFPAWLDTLTARERHIIRGMADSERTKDLSRRFQVSPARISQLRQEFKQDWERFCADPVEQGSRAAE